MSITNYIIQLKEKTGLSYMELAKQTGLTYQNIMDIKNDRIQAVSKTVLDKLSKYEKRSKKEMLYDILYKEDEEELLKHMSKGTLLYLCDLYIDSYGISLFPNYPSIISVQKMTFEAMAYKKRMTNNYMLIDSWANLKKEHWKLFRKDKNYNKDNFVDYFISENAYLYDVLLYGIGKSIAVKDNALKEYVMIFDKETRADFDLVKGFEIYKVNIKITYLYIEE
ncbi:MAG: helix-turn-helix transcriptional regulator [Erysipelotrichaceae bacterium]|nr:helix-turn-helix transcriptional regulator [Erysipelotrichaceae bacterium]